MAAVPAPSHVRRSARRQVAIKKSALACLILALALFAGPVRAGENLQLQAAIHVHSAFSSGRFSISELAAQARDKGLDVLVLTDHDRVAMEYGLPPFRRLLRLRVEEKSVLQAGADRYLAEIARVNDNQSSVLIIPGVQSSPFYHWTGTPWDGDLTAHGYHRELLLVGMRKPEDYGGLPLMQNGAALRVVAEKLPAFGAAGIGFLSAGALAALTSGRLRRAAGVLALIAALALLELHPFRSSRFDPYHGDQGAAPFQEIIDYVRSRGGLVFWAHPESNYPVRGIARGPVTLVTGHYTAELAAARNYNGFAALYGDTETMTRPGALWDQLLDRYCRGERSEPVWAVAEADFHGEEGGTALDDFQTVIESPAKTTAAVLEALRGGRCYAVRKVAGPRMVMEEFALHQAPAGAVGHAGDEIDIRGVPRIRIRIAASDGGVFPVSVELIRGGVLLHTVSGETPLAVEFTDADGWDGRTFYRVVARAGDGGRLVGNPIFARKS
jgi:hypothetical protein